MNKTINIIRHSARAATALAQAARRATAALAIILLTAMTAGAEGVTINSAEDWNTFAAAVSNGTTYIGEIVTLGTDITVSTMAGTSQTNSFKGTFYGGGHTLTFNATATADNCAPFGYVDGAMFKCLKVAGIISTGYKFAAGIAAHSYGNCTIQNCQSSVTVNSTISGDGTHAGFVAVHESGTLTITNCLFEGSITGSSTTNCGGFVGWRNATLTFNNCLMAGTMGISQTDGSALFNRNGSSTLTNCYYDGSKSYGSIAKQNATSTTVTGSDLQALLGSGWQVSGTSIVPIMDAKNLATATISGIDSYYLRTGSEIKPEPSVTAADGTTLTKNTDYTVEWSGDGKTDGTYTIVVTGIGNYNGSQSVSYVVSIVPQWLRIDSGKSPGDEGYYYVNMPNNGSVEYEIPDGFEESFQVRWNSHGNGKETGTITLTVPSGRKMTYSGEWSNGSSYSVDCSYSIKEGSTTKYSGNDNRTFTETTTAGSSLTVSCYHNGIRGALTLNVKMKADPIRVSNLSEFYAYTGSNISVSPTVSDADNSTTLAAGTDYEVTFSPATVKDKGVYTATISGKGSYSFTKTFNFLVGTLEYVDENGTTQTKAQDELTLLTTRNDLPATLTGWYLVADNITFSHVVEISGTAHLILADGTTMNANRIRVNSGNTLNIYAQTGGAGKLVVSPRGLVSNDAGIGSSQGNDCGTIVINGGDITSEGFGAASGIGASYYNSCGTIIINDGKIVSKGGDAASDIGGSSGSLTINGGQISANTNGIKATTISLGWRNAENDYVQSAAYSGTVSFQEGKPFIIDDGTNVDATADNIGGKKIVPKHGTISYSLDYATISGIEKAYAPNDAGISLQYSVVYTGNTPLLAGTDYTAAITDSNNQTVDVIKTPGRYTLTITGAGSYTGTKTATITVYGFKETLGGYEFSTSGDADGLYYLVDSENALRAIATYVNSGNDAYGRRFVQTQNITMTGGNFIPIGKHQTGGELFDGIYDGRNFTISALTVTSEYGYIGLFGGIGNVNHSATVKNVILVSPTVSATNSGSNSAEVGTLVGSCNDNCTVDNCIVINPTVSISGTNKVAGAIVGELYFNTNRMTNCYFYDSDANHSYAALGNNSGSTVTNVGQVYKITATHCTATATPTISVGGADYYKQGTDITVTATIPSSGMKKFTATGATTSTTETLGQYTLSMPANDVTVSLEDVTPTITLADIDLTYTGTEKTPAITSVTDGETIMTAGTDYNDVTYINNTNAGEATVSITGKGMYLGPASTTFTISPASVTLTANSRNTDTYDGTEKTVTGYTSSVDGLTFAESVSASGSGTNAGEHDVTFSGVTLNETKDNTGNYVITATTNGKLTINPASVTLTANSDTKVYNGAEQTLEGFTCSVDDLTFTGVSASGSGTNTGSYDVTFTGVTLNETKDNTGNYVVTNTTNGTLTIVAAETNYGAAKIIWNESGTTVEFNGASEEEVSITSDIEVDAVTYTRTFTADKASTVMLPFDYICNGNEGGKFYEFVGVTYDNENSKWVATMQEPGNTVTELRANTPYVFMPSGTALTFPNIANMTGGIVTLNTTKAGGSGVGSSASGEWQFHGTYAKKTWDAASNDYGFAATSGTEAGGTAAIEAGQFVRFTTNAFIKPMRCYLSYIGTTVPAPARGMTRSAAEELPQSITVRLLSRSGETTGIGTLDTQTGEFDFDGWYDMNGRKLNGKPAKKGLYINNGKKIVIK